MVSGQSTNSAHLSPSSPPPCPSGQGVGGGASNTPPQTLQRGGEDWLEVCLYVRWQTERWQTLTATLDVLKEAGTPRDGAKICAPLRTQALSSDGEYLVQPVGYRLGDKRKGPQVKYAIERQGVKFGILNRQEPHETIPNVHVIISGDAMLFHGGVDRVWTMVCAWLADLGAEIIESKVSRVDVAVDLPGVDVREFYDAFLAGRVITRAKKAKQFGEDAWRAHHAGRKATGITIGNAPMVRVYDKLAECKDPGVREMLKEQRWGGKIPEKATRVEFQLRGDFLKEGRWFGFSLRRSSRKMRAIVSVQDWINQRVQVCEYLTRKWLRFVTDGLDRRHTERAENMPVWEIVCRSIVALWTRIQDAAPRIDYKAIKVDALLSQVRGCMERVAAIRREAVHSAEDFLGFMVDELAHFIEGDNAVVDRIREKLGSMAEPAPHPVPI